MSTPSIKQLTTYGGNAMFAEAFLVFGIHDDISVIENRTNGNAQDQRSALFATVQVRNEKILTTEHPLPTSRQMIEKLTINKFPKTFCTKSRTFREKMSPLLKIARRAFYQLCPERDAFEYT